MPAHTQPPAAWEEIWLRLRAFRQHLPDDHEIEERLVRDYHGMVDEIEALVGLSLASFRVPPEDLHVDTGFRDGK
jgi:hypothetical protein